MMDLTFALGVLGAFQTTFLPGLLLAQVLRIQDGIRFVTCAFGLSLVFNYVLVCILTAIHLYKSPIMYTLLVVELSLLLWIYKRQFWSWGKISVPDFNAIRFFIRGDEGQTKFESSGGPGLKRRIVSCLLILLVLGTFLYFGYIFLACLGKSFTTWDALISWNRWAVDWFYNGFPKRAWHYPQLLPVNWSISYIIMGRSDLHLFNKAVMPLFGIFSLLLLLDLGHRRKDTAFYLAVVMLGYLLCTMIRPLRIAVEYADVPAMFFTLLGVYWLLISNEARSKAQLYRNICLAALFCAASALTKQSGLYIAVLFPLFAYFLALQGNTAIDIREKVKMLVIACAGIMLLVGSWYVYKELQIHWGQDSTETTSIQRLVQSKPIVDSILNAVQTIPSVIIGMLVIFLLNSLRTPLGLRLFLLIILPYTLIWVLFFRYDARLASVTFPFIAICIGLGFRQAFLNNFTLELPQLKTKTIGCLQGVYCAILAIGLVLILSHTILTTPVLVQKNHESVMSAVSPGVNEKLYLFHRLFGFQGYILTSYQPLGVLPEIKQFYKYCDKCDLVKMQQWIKNDVSIKYVLVYGPCKRHRRHELVKSGQFKILMPLDKQMCLLRVGS